ncbi:unnamed protein product, partial [Discosporangium mesarthrocarpum]
MVVRDDFSRYTWVYPLRRESEASEKLKLFLAENNLDTVPSAVLRVCSDDGGEFLEGSFAFLFREFRIAQEHTTANTPQLNGVAEWAKFAARLQAQELYGHVVDLHPHENLWAEASLWDCHTLNRTASSANPDNMSPLRLYM